MTNLCSLSNVSFGNSNYLNKLKSKNNNPIKENDSSFKAWLKDADKICTDGKDDGKLSFKEASSSFGKGLLGIVKTTINHPIKTLASVAVGAGVVALTGGAALPILALGGVALGVGTIGFGAYKAISAKKDGDAKQAFETMGNGTFSLAASALSSKSALKFASKAGVESATGIATNNPIKNLYSCAKVMPEALKISARNAKGNFLTLSTGKLHAHCNEFREDTMPFKSKPNEVQAYRFNPNGTPEEILANNPGVFRGEDGCFYVKNKWDASSPFKIDTTKEQMIMMYDGMNDMAVCDGGVFAGSYVDTAQFKADGTLSYQNPEALEYGKVINATKQAFGEYKMLELGTEVETIEGPNTIDPGEIVSLDHEGNPYVVMLAKHPARVEFINKAS